MTHSEKEREALTFFFYFSVIAALFCAVCILTVPLTRVSCSQISREITMQIPNNIVMQNEEGFLKFRLFDFFLFSNTALSNVCEIHCCDYKN